MDIVVGLPVKPAKPAPSSKKEAEKNVSDVRRVQKPLGKSGGK